MLQINWIRLHFSNSSRRSLWVLANSIVSSFIRQDEYFCDGSTNDTTRTPVLLGMRCLKETPSLFWVFSLPTFSCTPSLFRLFPCPPFILPPLMFKIQMLPINIYLLTYAKVMSLHVNRLFEQNSQIIYHAQFVSHPPGLFILYVGVFNFVRAPFLIKQATLCVPSFLFVRQLGTRPFQSSRQLWACTFFNLSGNLACALFHQVSNSVHAPFLLKKEYSSARPFSRRKKIQPPTLWKLPSSF
jgi:hypothetical protein